jgi:hypothetical protein
MATTFMLSSREALASFQFHVSLDEFNRSIRAGDDGLHAGSGEPVDLRAAGRIKPSRNGACRIESLDRFVRQAIGQAA